MGDSRPFSRFVHRAHRRRIVWRSVEHAATGLLIGCAIASVVLAVAWWRAVEPIGPALTILFVATVAGIVASIWRRPTPFDTARLIETQLNSPELLSSALLASSHADRSFIDALCALADARIAGVSPSSLVLRRLGSRTWSGIGLATAGVIVMALMISAPIGEREAIAKSPESVDAWLNNRAASQDQPPAMTSSRADSVSQRDRVSSHSMSDATTDAANDGASKPNARSSDAMSTGKANSRGAGSASSDAHDADATSPHATSSQMNAGTLAAAGTGVADNVGTNGANNPGIVGSSKNATRIAPWKAESWSHDRDAALGAVRAGAIPDSYRSLVQDYFNRP